MRVSDFVVIAVAVISAAIACGLVVCDCWVYMKRGKSLKLVPIASLVTSITVLIVSLMAYLK